MSVYGPRATIKRVGVCEQLPDGGWWLSGWNFNGRGDPTLGEHGCPFMHGERGEHVGILGWPFPELKAISDAEMELARLETADPAS